MHSRLLIALLLLLSLSISTLGQVQSTSVQDDKDDIVRITTNLVQIDVVVTKDGKVVKGLQPTDFEIFEDGKRQTITNFLYVSNTRDQSAPATTPIIKEGNKTVALPPVPIKVNESRRIMALVIDDLGLSAESMAQVRKQLRKFVDEQMQPNDLIAIIRTGADIGALQQFTNDKRLLHSAIKQAHWNICSRVGPTVFAPIQPITGPTMSDGNSGCGIMSIRSSLRSLRFILQAMGELPGRKSMVLFSDSIPSQEQEVKFPEEDGEPQRETIDNDRAYYGLLQRLAEIAIRNSVVIYGVDTQGLQYTGPTAADSLANIAVRSGTTAAAVNAQLNAIRRQRTDTLLRRREGADILSKETGGFLVRNSNDFQLDRIVDDQQGYYLLGYRPSAETFNRRFHKISAKVKGGFSLRTRKGFYGFAEEEIANMRFAEADPTMLALSSPFRASDLEIDLTTIFANHPDSGPLLRSFLYMSGQDITFTPDTEGWHKGTVQIEGVIFGNNGRPLDRIVVTPTVRLTQSGYQQALREGIVLRFDMPVKRPGDYQLRVAAKDLGSSRIGSAGQFVTVPNLANHDLAISGIVLSGEEAKSITITAPQTSQNSTATRSGRPEIMNNPVNRKFAAGSKLLFACYIYNATLGSNNQPKLTAQVKMYHEGKLIISTDQMPLDLRGQNDPARPIANGFVQLQPDLEPGRYFLQIVVSDLARKGKEAPAMQLIDFEVVKN